MALEIRENRGIFEILGNIASPNLGALKVYFDSVLESNENIVISLEGVSSIDSSAALFFENLYREGASQNKVIAIVGRQNRDIMQIMNQTKTDYILSSDRI